MSICMESTAELLILIIALVIMMAAFSCFVAIRVSGFIVIPMVLGNAIATSVLLVILTFFSEVDENCGRFLIVLRSAHVQCRNRMMAMRIRSMRRISFRCGVYAVVTRMFALFTTKLIIDLTSNLLLCYSG